MKNERTRKPISKGGKLGTEPGDGKKILKLAIVTLILGFIYYISLQ